MKVPKMFKKALSESFNHRKPRRLAAFTFLLATAGAGSAYIVATETPSGVRDPALGAQQYNRLEKDFSALKDLKAEMTKTDKVSAFLRQQSLAAPEDGDLQDKMWEFRRYGYDIEGSYDRARDEFKDNLLASEGISEKDAMTLIAAFEKKLDTETFRRVQGGNRLAHLDECQAEPKSQENPFYIEYCLSDASEMPGKAFSMLGLGLLGAFAGIKLGHLGARYERELPKEDTEPNRKKRKKKKITIKLLND